MNIFLIKFLILLFGLRQSAHGIPIHESITEDTNGESNSPIPPLLMLNTMEGIFSKLLFSNGDPPMKFEKQFLLLNTTTARPEAEIKPEVATTTKPISESTSQAIATENVTDPSINQNIDLNSKTSNQSADSAIEPNTTVAPKIEVLNTTTASPEAEIKPEVATTMKPISESTSQAVATENVIDPSIKQNIEINSKTSNQSADSAIERNTTVVPKTEELSTIKKETFIKPNDLASFKSDQTGLFIDKLSTETAKQSTESPTPSTSSKSEISTSKATTIQPKTSSPSTTTEKEERQNSEPLIKVESNQSIGSATNKFESLDTSNGKKELSTETIKLQNEPADKQNPVSGYEITLESGEKLGSLDNFESNPSNADEFLTENPKPVFEEVNTPELSGSSLSTLTEKKTPENAELLNKFESADPSSIEALINNFENVNESPTSISVAESATQTQFKTTNQANTENSQIPINLSTTYDATPYNSNENNLQATEAIENPNFGVGTEVSNLNNNDYFSDDAAGLTAISKEFEEEPIMGDTPMTTNNEPEGSGLGEIANNDFGLSINELTIENLTTDSETNMSIPNSSSTTAGASASELHENATNNLDKQNTTPMVVIIQKETSTVQASGTTTSSTTRTASTDAISTFKPILTMLTSVSTTTPSSMNENYPGDKSRETKSSKENAAPSAQTASILLIAISFFYSRISM